MPKLFLFLHNLDDILPINFDCSFHLYDLPTSRKPDGTTLVVLVTSSELSSPAIFNCSF